MKFYQANFASPEPPRDAQFPCAVLVSDRWNDFGFYTTWQLKLYRLPSDVIVQGAVKILQRKPDYEDEALKRTNLPATFEVLSEDYCSLGQSIDYYHKLRQAGRGIYEPFFAALRDAAIYPSVAEAFLEVDGFLESLTRFSEAQTVLNEARSIIFAEESKKILEFKFTCTVPGAERPHVVGFNFSPDPTTLNRTAVLIGKNGTGKTQVLAQLARAISGWTEHADLQAFSPSRPTFSQVIAVSYSVFDDFLRPSEGERTVSYRYCGIRAADVATSIEEAGVVPSREENQGARFLSPSELSQRLITARNFILIGNREEVWRSILSVLLEGATIPDGSVEDDLLFYEQLSSGQKILVAITTEIIAYVKPQSMILFDEPELHLHPEVFAAFARSFDRILREFESYAIIATHSPLLLQETWSRQVQIFRRRANIPAVEILTVESFGENLTNITQEVFSMEAADHNFRAILQELIKGRTPDEVESLFPLGLPLQAQVYLRALNTRGSR